MGIVLDRGRWRVQIRRRGRRISKSFDSKALAQSFHDAMIGKIELDDPDIPDAIRRRHTAGVTVSEAIDEWLSSVSFRGQDKPFIAKRVKSKIGALLIKGVRPIHISRFLEWCLKPIDDGGAGLSIRSTYLHRSFLSALFTFLIQKRGFSGVNPARGHSLPRLPDTDPQRVSESDIIKILDACRDGDMFLAVCIAVETGLRLGEIYSFVWGSVDLNGPSVIVHRRGKYGIEINKVNKRRSVPLVEDSAAHTHLRARFEMLGNPAPDVRIFKRKSTAASSAFSDLKKSLGLHHLEFRTFRHEACFRFADALEMHELMSVMGHTSISTTRHYYEHDVDDIRDKIRKRTPNNQPPAGASGDA